jgi:phenylacetate-CoA ligase
LTDGRLDRYRQPLIAALLAQAWSNVPYYRRLLAPFVRDGELDVARWTEIPLLHASDVRAHVRDLTAERLPDPFHEAEEATGEGRVPVHLRSRLSRVAADCERERVYEFAGLDLSRRLAVLHPDHPATTPSGHGWSVTFERNSWVAGDVHASPSDQLAWLAASQASQLRVDAASATGLADAALSSGTKLKLEFVVVSGDALPATTRDRLAEAFGASVLHLVELPVIGLVAASLDGGFSVPAASVIIEVVDAGGRPVASGSTGEIVLTPLYEFATPLLRFATGIAAETTAEPGLAFGVRRLLRVPGRVSR